MLLCAVHHKATLGLHPALGHQVQLRVHVHGLHLSVVVVIRGKAEVRKESSVSRILLKSITNVGQRQQRLFTCPSWTQSEEETGCTERCRSDSLCLPPQRTSPGNTDATAQSQWRRARGRAKEEEEEGEWEEQKDGEEEELIFLYPHRQLHHHANDSLSTRCKVEAF